MSRPALNSPEIRSGIKEILLNFAGRWEELRKRGGSAEHGPSIRSGRGGRGSWTDGWSLR